MLNRTLCKLSSFKVKYLNTLLTRRCSTKIANPKPLKIDVDKEVPSEYKQSDSIKLIPDTKPPMSNRIVRQDPGVVRLGFIPDEWFVFFFNKTGVSGFGTFCTTLSTFLISKEYYVLEEGFYTGISMAILSILAVKFIGPSLAQYLDKEIDEYEKSLNKGRNDEREYLEQLISHESDLQLSNEGQLLLVEAKRENVDLQREAAYRQRLLHCYKETKKRLDYQVECEYVKNEIFQKHMSQWVSSHVRTSVSPELEEKVFQKCIQDLVQISKNQQESSITAIAIKT